MPPSGRFNSPNSKNYAENRRKEFSVKEFDASLPHDKLAEQAVLGAIIINNSSLLKISDFLRVNDFFSLSNRKMFEGMLDLNEKKSPIDELTLSGWLKKKIF